MNEEYFSRNLTTVRFLKKFSGDNFEQQISKLSKKEVKFLAECAFNILKGIIPLEGKELIKAKSFKHLYKEIVSRKNNLEEKRKIFSQNLVFTKALVNLIFQAFEDEF